MSLSVGANPFGKRFKLTRRLKTVEGERTDVQTWECASAANGSMPRNSRRVFSEGVTRSAHTLHHTPVGLTIADL
jgi:hypothetical protein